MWWLSAVAHACLVTITSTLLGVDGQAMDRCLTCDDFNRQSNGPGDGQCMDSYEDCGDCKYGFIKDEVDLRLCYQLELTRSPSDVVSGVGESQELPCTFNGPVECEWSRDGHVVAVGGRYEYVVESGEGGRRDCSLRISSLSAVDVGRWRCGSRANSMHDSLLSKPIRISIATTIKPTAASRVRVEDSGSEGEDQPTITVSQRPAMETYSNVQSMSSINTTTLMTALKSIIILMIVLLAMLTLCILGFVFGKCLRSRWRQSANGSQSKQCQQGSTKPFISNNTNDTLNRRN